MPTRERDLSRIDGTVRGTRDVPYGSHSGHGDHGGHGRRGAGRDTRSVTSRSSRRRSRRSLRRSWRSRCQSQRSRRRSRWSRRRTRRTRRRRGGPTWGRTRQADVGTSRDSRRVHTGTRWRRLRIYYESPPPPLGATTPANASGSGGDAVEAIADLLSIAGYRQGTILAPVTAWRRLPGRCGTWPLDILVCSAALWPQRTTISRASERTIRAHDRAAETAPPGHGTADHGDHGDHGGPGRPRRSRSATANHGGSRPNVSNAGSRPRRHEPGAHGTGQGAHGAVRT